MSKALSPLAVKNAKPGRYCDGDGLWLFVTKTGTRSWILRYMRDGRSREMGLGPVRLISLQEARQRARDAQRLLLDGTDPIDQRKAARGAAKAESARAVTFAQCAERYIVSHEKGWRNDKHRAQWRATIETYCNPTIGELSVTAIDTALVLKCLEPIWTVRPETASRVRGRIEAVLDWATARQFRTGENPARWRGHLDKLLPSRAKVKRVRHHPAMGYAELPQFMGEMNWHSSVSACALQFTILCAARTGETIGASWTEIDLKAAVWTIPAGRMKANRPHRVPLSSRALAILHFVADIYPANDFVFPGARKGQGLSNMAMAELLKGLRPGLTVHGFRSTFRDWVAETTTHPEWLAEAALAHSVADKVAAAYQRSDLLEKRRQLMQDWADYCGSVVAIHRPALTVAARV
jgi:integrase